LQGQYEYSLHFRLDKEGEDGYIVRSHGNYMMNRSVSTDLELEAGTYSVLMKITAKRYTTWPTPEETLRNSCKTRQEKLVQIGLAYDLAHARGQVKETEEEKKEKAEKEEKAKAAAIKKKREEARKLKYKEWVSHKKQVERRNREKQRAEEHKRKKAEAAEAAVAATTPDESRKDKDTPAETVEASKDDKPAAEVVEAGKNDKPTTEVVEASNDDKPAAEAVEASKDDKPATEVVDEQAGAAAKSEPAPASSEPEAAKSEAPATAPAAADPPPAKADHPTVKPDTATEAKDLTTQAKIDQFNKDLQAVQENNPTLPAPGAPTEISDTDSIHSFSSSIISDLDFDPEAVDPAPVEVAAEEVDEENEEFANDPWNAVCVVGLSVFSKVGEGKGVSIRVVRPKEVGEGETELDLDDPSRGMTEEGVKEGEAKDGETTGRKRVGDETKGEENKHGEVIENGS